MSVFRFIAAERANHPVKTLCRVLDVSRSMEWCGAPAAERLTKRAYAEQLTAALSLLLLRQRDAVGLVRFDDAVRTSVPPRARTTQWRRILGALTERSGGRASDVVAALAQVGVAVIFNTVFDVISIKRCDEINNFSGESSKY